MVAVPRPRDPLLAEYVPTYLSEALKGFPKGGVCRDSGPLAFSRQQPGYPVQVAVAYAAA